MLHAKPDEMWKDNGSTDHEIVYPTSISVKQYRECTKVDRVLFEKKDKKKKKQKKKTILSALVDPNPPLLTVHIAHCSDLYISNRHFKKSDRHLEPLASFVPRPYITIYRGLGTS